MTGVWLAGLCALLIGLLPVARLWDDLRVARWWARRGRGSDAVWDAGARRSRPAPSAAVPSRRARSRRRDVGAALSLVVTEVSGRLRAGAPTDRAWRESWERAQGLGSWGVLDEGGAPSAVVRLARRPRWRDLGRGASLVDVLRARRVSERAGRRAAAALAAACRFTQRLGAPLADVLDAVADGIDETAAAEDARRVARTGPTTSARILMALPVLGVIVGEALGARTLERFADGAVGTACLVVGLVCLLAGRAVSGRMLSAAEGATEAGEDLDPAILCDLAVAGLESGASVPATLGAIGDACGLPDLGRIGRELTLGSPWRRAWDPCPAAAQVIGDALEPAWTHGASPVPVLRRAAAQLRARRVAQAKAEAEELGVRLVVPLGALLLPAFLALGVVPVLLHLGTGGFAGP